MSTAIKNVSFSWGWTGDESILTGFNVALCKSGETPLTGSVASAFVPYRNAENQPGELSSSYTFRGVLVEVGEEYVSYAQAIYPGSDSPWLASTGVVISDDGSATVATGSDLPDHYFQTEMPLTGKLGDTWVDTDDDNQEYRHNGIEWIPGKFGQNGVNGTRTAILDMYQVAVDAPTTFPVGSSTYIWAMGQFTAPATANSWTLVPGAVGVGETLWICRTLYADTETTTESNVTWDATYARAAGGSGADGSNGASVAFLELYKWAPAGTSSFTYPVGSSTYAWDDGSFTLPATPNGWALAPGASTPGYELFACAVRYVTTTIEATTAINWSTRSGVAYVIGGAGTNGSNGTNARSVSLSAGTQGFAYNTAGATPAPATTTLTATALNTTGTVYYEFIGAGATVNTTTNTRTYTPAVAFSSMPQTVRVNIREGASTGTILASDSIVMQGLRAGSSALTVVLPNGSHTLPASSAGVVSSYAGSGTTIQVYEGSTLLTDVASNPGPGQFTIGTPTQLPLATIAVGAISGAGTTTATVAAHSAMVSGTSSVVITYPITLKRADGTTITTSVTQTLTKSLAGAQGVQGVSITGVTNYYLASASSSGVTTATAGWTTSIQNPTALKPYLWNYESIAYSSGSPTVTVPSIIGNFAAAGKGISAIVEYYQLSTSNSSAPTGTWLTTPPVTTTTNKYLWNYERITYTDSSFLDTAKRVIGTHGDVGPNAPSLGIKKNFISFTSANDGECYIHGFNAAGDPADVNGYIEYNGTKLTVPKQTINPSKIMDGYLVFDTALTNLWSGSITAATFAGGVWTAHYYKDATAMHTVFPITTTMVVIGTISLSAAEMVSHATVYGYGVSPLTVAEPGATVGAPAGTVVEGTIKSGIDGVNLPPLEAGESGFLIRQGGAGFAEDGVWKSYLGANGDFKLGDGVNNPGVVWDQAAGALGINGAVVVDGSITGTTLQTEVTASRGIKISTANGFEAFDSSGQKTLDVTTSGQVTLKGNIEVTPSRNMIANSEFLNGSFIGWEKADGAPMTSTLTMLTPPNDWCLSGAGTIELYSGAIYSGYTAIYTNQIAVTPNRTYEFQVATGAHRCIVSAHVSWYTGAGAHISSSTVYTNSEQAAGGRFLSGYKILGGICTAPATAVYGRLTFAKGGTVPGQTTSYLFATRAFFGEAYPGQTELSSYAPMGGNITGSVITGSTLQTALSGKRAAIYSSDYSDPAMAGEMQFHGDAWGNGSVELMASIGIRTVGNDTAIALFGNTNTNHYISNRCVAVHGISHYIGVKGESTVNGTGVHGKSETGIGTSGQTNGGAYGSYGFNYGVGVGVYGGSYSGNGVEGNAYSAAKYDFKAVGSGINGPFTGAHDGLVLNNFVGDPGDIMVDALIFFKQSISNTVAINELSIRTKQSNILGVLNAISQVEDVDDITALMTWPDDSRSLNTIYKRVTINALGEGQINVCNEGGNIQAGDYICSSNHPGKGMKQDDDLLHNYTVAKAREDCVWAGDEDDIRMIACSYHCG